MNFVSGGLFSLMGSAVLCAACPSLPMALLTQVEMCHLSSLPHFWGFWIRVLYNTGSWELKVFWFLLSNPRAFISFVINTWCPKWWVRVDFFFLIKCSLYFGFSRISWDDLDQVWETSPSRGKPHGYLRSELQTMCSKNWWSYKGGS